MKHRLLDLFCGRFGWSRAFADHGWECVGVDLIEPELEDDVLQASGRLVFVKADVLTLTAQWILENRFDFICASSPCEQFSVHGMKHFNPTPPQPEFGLKLFNHTRSICEASGLPYVIENVRAAQAFVGKAVHHCGPFYLWGNAVPPLMAQGVTKGIDVGSSKLVKTMGKEERRVYRAQFAWNQAWPSYKKRGRDVAKAATIPIELSTCVADYADRLMQEKRQGLKCYPD